ncbi:MAG: DNA polymerase I, partial [Bacteroidota bacterium]
EADDVIGTLALQAEKEGFTTSMMTPVKDYGQLITEKTLMYRPARTGSGGPEIWGIEEVCAKFEINEPKQVIDILGLWGDAVDNIPGVPGVGEKTAKKLIGLYGSVEGVYEHVGEIKGKLGEKVAANEAQALLSKQLATIITDAPVAFNAEDLAISAMDKEALKDVFTELEFRQLSERILGEAITVAPQPVQGDQMSLFGAAPASGGATVEAGNALATLDSSAHEYHLVDTPEKRANLVGRLQKASSFCFDTETTGLDVKTAELVGIAFAIKAGEAFYVPVPDDADGAQAIVEEFRGVLTDPGKEKIAHNLKYDLAILARYQLKVEGPLFDTMIAHYLIEPDMRRRSMDALSEMYLGYSPVSIEELIGPKGKDQKSMRDVPVDELTDYASEDADITLRLYETLSPKLDETETRSLFAEIEAPLVPVLCSMEMEGIRLDAGSLESLSAELGKDALALQEKIYGLAGMDFNIGSPKQVGEVLFDHLKVTEKAKKTKTGQYSTSEDVLNSLRHQHDIIPAILEFREVQKLKNTYVDVLPRLINPQTGRLHTSYSQAVAATGRLSSDNPNLQNIPIRTERGRQIREAFVPRNEDYVLLSADYSQIELRIIASLSKDPGMIEAFRNNIDIHASTASRVFGVELDAVTREMRSKAKAVNFGLAYGQGAFGLAQNLGIPRKEAKEIIDSYFEQFPGIHQYMDDAKEFARKHGYSQTLRGRRRYLRDINSANHTVRSAAERNAINAPIQGSAADMIKIAMVRVHERMQQEGFQSRMLLQVHDELVFDAHRDEVDRLKPLVKELMEGALEMEVPILVESGTGDNWLEAH